MHPAVRSRVTGKQPPVAALQPDLRWNTPGRRRHRGAGKAGQDAAQITESHGAQRRGQPLIQLPGGEAARREVVAQQRSGTVPFGSGGPA